MRKFLVILALLILFSSASAAEIHGKVYEWFSLDELDNVVIDVNSVPGQRVVSKDGSYGFELALGDYLLHAEYFEDGERKYVSDEIVRIVEDGSFIVDIIMFPPEIDVNSLEQPDVDVDVSGEAAGRIELDWVVPIAAVIVIIIAALFLIVPKRGKQKAQRWESAEKHGEEREAGGGGSGKKPAEQTQAEKSAGLDKYAREVVEVLGRSGNRLTQKELREKITGIGEAKISLIVSELEEMGIVKKIKRGRGNIIVLKEGKEI